MKRFLVFAYDSYYPGGGWGDFQKSFDTLEAAKAFAETLKRPKSRSAPRCEQQWDFADVVDLETEQEL